MGSEAHGLLAHLLIIAPGEDTVATHQDEFTAGTGDRHRGSRDAGLNSLDLGTGGLSISASEMARAALITLTDNSMPTSSAQALIPASQGGESIIGATHPHRCFQEIFAQEEPIVRVLVETTTTMADG